MITYAIGLTGKQFPLVANFAKGLASIRKREIKVPAASCVVIHGPIDPCL